MEEESRSTPNYPEGEGTGLFKHQGPDGICHCPDIWPNEDKTKCTKCGGLIQKDLNSINDKKKNKKKVKKDE